MTREQLTAAVTLEHRIAELYRQRRAIEFSERIAIGFERKGVFEGEWAHYDNKSGEVIMRLVGQYMMKLIDFAIAELETKRAAL